MMKTSQSGQAVIEAIIALSALLVLLAAIAVVITTSLSNTTFSSNQDQANKYAQEGMEMIRNYSRANTEVVEDSTVFALTGPFCMGDTGEISRTGGDFVRDGCGVNLGNAFMRTVTFTQGFCDEVAFEGAEVTVDVAWSSGKCQCEDLEDCSIQDRYCHRASLVSCFARSESSSQL